MSIQKNINEQIDVHGQKLFIQYEYVQDKKDTLVFLHDSLGCIQLWRDFPKQLAEVTGCNILIYDRLGYGKSEAMLSAERDLNYLELEADILNSLLEILNINNAILFGHSDGGSIALIAGSKYKHRIKALIIEAGHIFRDELTLQGVQAAKIAYTTSNIAEKLSKYHGSKVDMLYKAWVNTWLKDEFEHWNIEHFLKNITCNLLFIQGEKDDYGTMEQLYRTIKQCSGKTNALIIPNIGHTPHKEIPNFIIEKVSIFIKDL